MENARNDPRKLSFQHQISVMTQTCMIMLPVSGNCVDQSINLVCRCLRWSGDNCVPYNISKCKELSPSVKLRST